MVSSTQALGFLKILTFNWVERSTASIAKSSCVTLGFSIVLHCLFNASHTIFTTADVDIILSDCNTNNPSSKCVVQDTLYNAITISAIYKGEYPIWRIVMVFFLYPSTSIFAQSPITSEGLAGNRHKLLTRSDITSLIVLFLKLPHIFSPFLTAYALNNCEFFI